jgi:hypothetical protein
MTYLCLQFWQKTHRLKPPPLPPTNLKEKKKPFSFFRFVGGSGGGLSLCCFSDT